MEAKMIADLVKVQGALPHLKKDAKANYGTYITLDAINDAILPLLAKNNLAWVTMPGYNESDEPVLNYALKHTSGEEISGSMKLWLDKTTSQGQGSAITYARRYAICAVLGLTADDDDDGKAADKPVPTKLVKPTPYNIDLDKLKIKARALMQEQGYVKEKAGEFLETVISKAKPETKQDYEDIIAALETA